MEYKAKPEYEKCVAISTEASIREMMLPGAIALITPILIGFLFGPEVLGGVLAGVTVSGVLMGMFQSNAGGAWDNAKKSFEKGVDINGETFYKKSEPHKAAVTGDTVGDPFKDTSGPSMNILIKLMSIVSLVIAPYLSINGMLNINTGGVAHGCNDMNKEQCAGKMEKCEAGKNCTYLVDTTYTDSLGHTIVEKKCIVVGDAASCEKNNNCDVANCDKPCCADKKHCTNEEMKKECCKKK
jgi:hypothetical protein